MASPLRASSLFSTICRFPGYNCYWFSKPNILGTLLLWGLKVRSLFRENVCIEISPNYGSQCLGMGFFFGQMVSLSLLPGSVVFVLGHRGSVHPIFWSF